MSTNPPPTEAPPPIPPPIEAAKNRLALELPPPVTAPPISTAQLSTATDPPSEAPPHGKPTDEAKSHPAGNDQGTRSEAAPSDPAASEDCGRSSHLNSVPSWLVSMVVHTGAMVIAGLITFDEPARVEPVKLVISPIESLIDVDDDMLDDEIIEPEFDLEITEPEIEIPIEDESDLEPDPNLSPSDNLMAAKMLFDDPAEQSTLFQQLSDGVPGGVPSGDELSGRGPRSRGALVRRGGGNDQSERAVALALKWLAAHQSKDGGWSFDHTQGTQCQNRCGNVGGARQARMAATAMALLPFLGAGHTHQSGKYRQAVYRGIHYLTGHQNKQTGSMHEPLGRMYSHGLAAIALCEAYAMTKDKTLRGPAQKSIDFIVYAQHDAGGWRYSPKQAGDTSVVGWQIMALKSAYLSYLRVPKNTITLANKFLDSVQAGEYGSQYGYTGPATNRQATTSIGLLCRMYLGWKKDHPGLLEGVDYLSNTAPSKTNMYYNYYATQVMHHMGGDEWKKWNSVMRDQLVGSQATGGHERGSWFMRDPHGSQGGRLYCTSMAAMILEVYYRHLPIYRKRSTEDDFPID